LDITQHTSTTATTVTLVGGHVALRLTATGGAGNFATVKAQDIECSRKHN